MHCTLSSRARFGEMLNLRPITYVNNDTTGSMPAVSNHFHRSWAYADYLQKTTEYPVMEFKRL